MCQKYFSRNISRISYFINIRLVILVCGQIGRQHERHTNTAKINRHIVGTSYRKRADNFKVEFGNVLRFEEIGDIVNENPVHVKLISKVATFKKKSLS